DRVVISWISGVRNQVERFRLFDSEPAGNSLCRRAARRSQEHKTHASMNRKDRSAIVKADERVERVRLEQMTPKGRGRVMGGDTGREDESKPASSSQERQGTFEEQLIAIHVTGAL